MCWMMNNELLQLVVRSYVCHQRAHFEKRSAGRTWGGFFEGVNCCTVFFAKGGDKASPALCLLLYTRSFSQTSLAGSSHIADTQPWIQICSWFIKGCTWPVHVAFYSNQYSILYLSWITALKRLTCVLIYVCCFFLPETPIKLLTGKVMHC